MGGIGKNFAGWGTPQSPQEKNPGPMAMMHENESNRFASTAASHNPVVLMMGFAGPSITRTNCLHAPKPPAQKVNYLKRNHEASPPGK